MKNLKLVSDIKIFERPKNIKESKDSLPRNFWKKYIYIYDYTIEKYKRKIGCLQKYI